MKTFIYTALHRPYRFIQHGSEILADDHRSQMNIKQLWPDFSIQLDKPELVKYEDIESKVSRKLYEVKLKKIIEWMSNELPKYASNVNEKCLALNIDKGARILDIGAYKNVFLLTIGKQGYHNTLGIDTDAVIQKHLGLTMNFRDMPLNKTFDIIHFSRLLDYMSGGVLNMGRKPSLELFFSKVLWHLNDNGYLFFSECCYERMLTSAELILRAFKFTKCPISDESVHIWRKHAN